MKGGLKTQAGQEFCDLVDESGLIPAEIARLMKMSEGNISKYLSGQVSPPDSRVDALRRIVSDIKGSSRSHSTADAIRENAPTSELETWKRRAKKAEGSLHALRTKLREVLDESNPSAPEPKLTHRPASLSDTEKQ